ncbi:hypothetical protein BDV06DRAFT_208068 [Aspergillus oleicola]
MAYSIVTKQSRTPRAMAVCSYAVHTDTLESPYTDASRRHCIPKLLVYPVHRPEKPELTIATGSHIPSIMTKARSSETLSGGFHLAMRRLAALASSVSWHCIPSRRSNDKLALLIQGSMTDIHDVDEIRSRLKTRLLFIYPFRPPPGNERMIDDPKISLEAYASK